MTDPLTVAVAATAGIVAIAAGVLSLPRPPVLDAERWFKVIMATVLRGREEGKGGDADSYERTVLRFVPYHPAGRDLLAKLLDPASYAPPEPLVAGERAMVARLAALDTVADRRRLLFETDPAGLAARLSDPEELGTDYRPDSILGPGATWDSLADWGFGQTDALAGALVRSELVWIVVGDDGTAPSVLGKLVEILGAHRIPTPAGPDDEVFLAEALAEWVPMASDRAVVVAAGDAAHLTLRALSMAGGLRDRVAAVVSVGGNLQGRPDAQDWRSEGSVREWMRTSFQDVVMDLEARRSLPCFSVQWMDSEAETVGFDGLPVNASLFPEPGRDPAGQPVLDVVDLGVLVAWEDLPADIVAISLATTVTAWVRTNGG